MAAMTGFGRFSTLSVIAWPRWELAKASLDVLRPCNMPTSAPEMKALSPAPVITTARTSSPDQAPQRFRPSGRASNRLPGSSDSLVLAVETHARFAAQDPRRDHPPQEHRRRVHVILQLVEHVVGNDQRRVVGQHYRRAQ